MCPPWKLWSGKLLNTKVASSQDGSRRLKIDEYRQRMMRMLRVVQLSDPFPFLSSRIAQSHKTVSFSFRDNIPSVLSSLCIARDKSSMLCDSYSESKFLGSRTETAHSGRNRDHLVIGDVKSRGRNLPLVVRQPTCVGRFCSRSNRSSPIHNSLLVAIEVVEKCDFGFCRTPTSSRHGFEGECKTYTHIAAQGRQLGGPRDD